jgi:hypothetical protein
MCALQCSAQFISIFENCHDQPLMDGFSAEDMAQWVAFYGQCQEVQQSAAEMGVALAVDVKMFRVSISSEAAQYQAEMFVGGKTQIIGPLPDPIIGPLPELPSPRPGLSKAGSASMDIKQYHAMCSMLNIMTCVPACNSTTHGYKLLATIDGTDSEFRCNLANNYAFLLDWTSGIRRVHRC